MKIEIKIEKEDCIIDEPSEYANLRAEANIKFLESLYIHRGYLYLNQIYERLGIVWDPRNINTCLIRNEENKYLDCRITKYFGEDSGEMLIKITTK